MPDASSSLEALDEALRSLSDRLGTDGASDEEQIRRDAEVGRLRLKIISLNGGTPTGTNDQIRLIDASRTEVEALFLAGKFSSAMTRARAAVRNIG